MGLSALKNFFKGSSCGCNKRSTHKNKRSTRKHKHRKNYRGGHTYSKKNTFKKTTIRLSSPSKNK